MILNTPMNKKKMVGYENNWIRFDISICDKVMYHSWKKEIIEKLNPGICLSAFVLDIVFRIDIWTLNEMIYVYEMSLMGILPENVGCDALDAITDYLEFQEKNKRVIILEEAEYIADLCFRYNLQNTRLYNLAKELIDYVIVESEPQICEICGNPLDEGIHWIKRGGTFPEPPDYYCIHEKNVDDNDNDDIPF